MGFSEGIKNNVPSCATHRLSSTAGEIRESLIRRLLETQADKSLRKLDVGLHGTLTFK